MKVRVKFRGQSHRVDLGERQASMLTLLDLMQAVTATLHADIGNINISLNQTEFLSGNDTLLADFGIVSGDLIYVTRTDGIENSTEREEAHQRSEPLSSWSSASNSSAPFLNGGNESSSDILSREARSTLSEKKLVEDSQETSHSDSNQTFVEKSGPDSCIMSQSTVNRFLLEPLVVRESTADQVPAILDHLYASSKCKKDNEALWVVLHTLMIESGFFPPGNEDLTSMPDGWNQTPFYSCNYEYVVTPHIVSRCMVVGVTMGSSISIHGLSKGGSDFQTSHLQLKAEHFVRTLSSHAPATFRALDRLSRQFKDVICLPLINHLSRVAGMGEEQGLLAIPCELRIRLLLYLDARSICHLGATCSYWNTVYKDNTVWRRLYLRDFQAPSDCCFQRKWYELYKEKFVALKEEEAHRQSLLHFSNDYRPQRSLPIPAIFRPGGGQPFFPHVIGGDYDVNPEFASGIRHPMDSGVSSRLNHRDISSRRGQSNVAASMFSRWI